MKKVLVAALAVALAAVMTVPAGAFENEFGGYWRTRAYTNQDFSGSDNGAQDLQMVDTRTRLYYTAKFSDNFKFVNKFEFDSDWGDDNGGKIGADGHTFKVKNSYVDFNLANYNVKVGAQGGYIGRGFVFDDDFSGLAVTGTFGNISVPVYWMKIDEGGLGKDKNDGDKDAIAISPVFKSGNMTINPFLVYVFQDETSYSEASKDSKYELDTTTGEITDTLRSSYGVKDINVYDLGISFDMALSNANVWATAIYQGGDYTVATLDADGKATAKSDMDLSSYLFAFGGDAALGNINVHGQMIYASGDDKTDSDEEAFLDILSSTGDESKDDGAGQSYYWAEIMGYGMFDQQVSAGSCADKISNLVAFNIGASMSPMEKLTLGADLWYAMHAEDVAGEDQLGTEIDLTAGYQVMDNLKLDVVAAYLFADDATGDEDPYELGAQLSLSF